MEKRVKKLLGILAAIPAVASLNPAVAQAENGVLPGKAVDGYFSNEYRLGLLDMSEGKSLTDQDWQSRLRFAINKTGIENLTFDSLTVFKADSDGTAKDSPFKDSLDGYSGRNSFELQRAYLNYEGPLSIRAGRQDVWSSRNVKIDGATISSYGPGRHVGLEVFGGSLVSFFSNPKEKEVLGFNLNMKSKTGSRMAIRELILEHQSFEGYVYQAIGEYGSVDADYRHYGDKAESLKVGADANLWEGASLGLGYFRKFSDAGDTYFYDFTPKTELKNLELPELMPFNEYSADFTQSLFGMLDLGAGAKLHQLVDKADEDAYNANFVQGYGQATVAGLVEGLTIGLEYDRWFEDRKKNIPSDDSWGGNVMVEQKIHEIRLGADAYRSSYDSQGRNRVTSGADIWVKAEVAENYGLDLTLSREKDDLYKEDGIDSITQLLAKFTVKL